MKMVKVKKQKCPNCKKYSYPDGFWGFECPYCGYNIIQKTFYTRQDKSFFDAKG